MSRLLAALIGLVGGVAVIATAALFLAVHYHRQGIDIVYKNVDDIVDGEMPTTVTSFPSGPEVVGIIGGSGEGLNCSLPDWADKFFDNTENEPSKDGKEHKRLLVRQHFRQACVFHDLCYRHGLATYNYNQNDCDRVLQNQAFRLCLYIRSDAAEPQNRSAEHNAERCQTDSKMILAGMGLGGSGAYRAWDKSTYFEFESDPVRSTGFSASRVVDHPFKSADRVKYAGDPDQVILTFANIRSNLTITCVTCKKVPVFEWSRDPSDVSAELRSVGIVNLPEALLKHEDQMLSATSPIWLPPRRRHAAPHLLVDSAGKNNLIWISRNNPENTVSCIVLADAARLLTYTLPKQDLCEVAAGSRLTMVEVDMFSTSPLPMEIPGAPEQNRIVATALSAQKTDDRSLSFCQRSASRPVNRAADNDDKAPCTNFSQTEVAGGDGLGAFQNFAVVRPGQQIFFARDVKMSSRAPSKDIYSAAGNVLVVDIAAPTAPSVPLAATIQKIVPFNIPDRFDPMMPITRKNNDLRFFSLEAPDVVSGTETPKSRAYVRMIDFANSNPVPEDVGLVMKANVTQTKTEGEIHLHESWAQRSVLVLETKGASPKSKLVFSRGKLAAEPGKPFDPTTNTESLRLETLVFERDASTAGSKLPFLATSGASCKITYTYATNPDYPCRRPFDSKRLMRSSPAAKMRASQTLVGHFTANEGHSIAFPDACLKYKPIVLRPKREKPGEFELELKEPVGKESDIMRTVDCGPIPSIEYISEAMKD